MLYNRDVCIVKTQTWTKLKVARDWRRREDDVKYSPEPAHENIIRFY